MAVLLKTWLWISALASLMGWALSIFGALNRPGYLIATALCLAGPTLVLARAASSIWSSRSAHLRKLFPRFRRRLAAVFLILALLALLGGILYPPSNYAGLSYRTPRVLQWLSEGHWFWIHTLGPRLNTRSCGFEWLSAPIFLFTGSDRALFLLNFIPFLLLPGLLFSVFTRLGVRPRVAWCWMWLLPTGYNFLLQAGSIGNDTFPTVYALAAVDFALRAWKSRRPSDLYYSLVAAALLTGAKPSNIPLLLPWFLLVVPLARVLLLKPVLSAVVCFIAAAVSFLPNALLNIIYCGDWSGLRLERVGMEMKEPLVGVMGNTFLILLNNLVPPFFPVARWWNDSAQDLLPHFLIGPMNRNFELGYLTLWEMPGEDWVGIGFGLTALVFITLGFGLFKHKTVSAPVRPGLLPEVLRRAVLISPWVALLAYMVKSGMVTPARLISPYYPLLLVGLLTGAWQAHLVRQCWWRALAFLTVLIALGVLVLTPARPLWPAQTILGELTKLRPGLRLAERALNVYQVYQVRFDPIPQLRQMLPPDLKLVGFLGDGDDLDISLWRPFFSRRVCHVLLRDDREDIRKRGVEYIVVGGAYLKSQGITLDEWLGRTGAKRVSQTRATLKVSEGPQDWFVVRLPAS